MSVIHKATYSSEIGTIQIIGTEQGILSVNFVDNPKPYPKKIHECLVQCIRQLDEYFHRRRTTFSVPLEMQGTDFEKKVWTALLDIPHGETRSYGQIAEKIGHPKAFRAVGNTNRKNSVAILIPCHRVIGSDGSLTGYACGLWRKEWLLAHEKNHVLKRKFHDF